MLLCEVFKSLNHLNPKYVSELYETKEIDYALRRSKKVHQPKKWISTFGLRSASYTGAKLWNDFCPHLSDEVN